LLGREHQHAENELHLTHGSTLLHDRAARPLADRGTLGSMTGFAAVRVAAIQATPVILDAERCAARAERLRHEAADEGAR
jgi:hypothetical protein